jgi:cytochrome c-type biogenesis protein CcmH
MMLGRSYGVLGDLEKSASAFARAAKLRPTDVTAQLSYAQSLLARSEAANKAIDRQTQDILEGVLKLDANQTFALYYLGLAAQQRKDNTAAKRHWEKLATLLPAGSEDAKRIDELLRSLN